jgi:hypothetical protein
MRTMHRLGLETPAAQALSGAINEVLSLGWDCDRRMFP